MGIFGWFYPAGAADDPFAPYNDTCSEDDCEGQYAGEWVTLCKRTNDPKLAYIESLLDKASIIYRRNGESWYAPILEVRESDEAAALSILDLPARKALGLPVRYGVTLDNVPDDHPCFGWA